MKKSLVQQARKFFEHDIWRISTKDKHPVFSFFVRQGRILFIAARGFTQDKIQLRASALSFYTLLSIVPILALVFGISQGFGFEEKLTSLLNDKFQSQKEVLAILLGFVDRYLSRINTGFITGIGFLILLWSVLKVLSNIESSFNNIWQVKKSRIITRKFTDYISLLIIAPVFLLVASSFNVSQLSAVSESFPFLKYLDSFLVVTARFVSFALIWVVFMLLYIVIPNTRVRFMPALIAGIIAGSMFQLLQWGYVNFQSLLSGYGAVYGTFAALPLFMMWLELSWLIVLLGAEISFAYQNAGHYVQEVLNIKVSQKHRRLLTLLVLRQIVHQFSEGLAPMNAAELAEKLGIPVRLMRDLIYELIGAGLVNEMLTQELRESAYQPAIDPALLTISRVVESLDSLGQPLVLDRENPEYAKLQEIVDSFYDCIRQSPLNTPLKSI